MKHSELFECAANLIEEKGLAKGRLYDPKTDSYCIIGAVNHCSNYSEASWAHLARFVKYAITPSGRVSVITWNDRKSHTKKQVVDVLRKAAQLAREEGK